MSTEHGPKGGDEINIIDIESVYKNEEILNFGWAISSYGEHYGEKKQNKIRGKTLYCFVHEGVDSGIGDG